MFLIPIVFLAVGHKWICLGLCVFGIVLWYITLQLKICTDCINFSCVLNRVPKEIRDEFLKKNPEMYEAWKASGYVCDDEEKEEEK